MAGKWIKKVWALAKGIFERRPCDAYATSVIRLIARIYIQDTLIDEQRTKIERLKAEKEDLWRANMKLTAAVENCPSQSQLTTYKDIAEKAEWVLSRSRRYDNHIGISYEDCNELDQALLAAKEAKDAKS